jgi:hypothetical protein
MLLEGHIAWGEIMTHDAFTDQPRGFGAKAKDIAAGAGEVTRSALQEAMTWSAYQWTVLALLTATFLLVALSYGGIRSELAALKQNQGGSSTQDLAAFRTEVNTKLGDMQSSLTAAMTEMKTSLSEGISKISAKVDARTQPKPNPPAPKPPAKPRAQ